MNSYSSRRAASIVGITYGRLDRWARSGIVAPSVPAAGSGSRRRYSYDDLIRLRVARTLNQAGVSLPAIPQRFDDGTCLVGIGLNPKWQTVATVDLPAVVGSHHTADVLQVLSLAAVKADVDLSIAAYRLGDVLTGAAS